MDGFVPSHYLKRIHRAHALGVEQLRKYGTDERDIEPVDVALVCESHRWAWKPERIRVVLIAESHVFTNGEDRRARIIMDALPKGLPNEFVRLVYCLGYGESQLLNARLTTRNGGTWQYWKLFAKLAGGEPYPLKRQKRPLDLEERLAWKIQTLRQLKERGIWLLDASFHAIKFPGGKRLGSKLVAQLHDVWWAEYGQPLCSDLKLEGLWCIGPSVHKCIGRKTKCDGWVYQPNADGRPNISYRQKLDELLCYLQEKLSDARTN